MQRTLQFLFTISCLISNLAAQTAFDKTKEIADAYFVAGEYARAIRYYEKCLEIRQENQLNMQLSYCYWYIHEYKESLNWFREYRVTPTDFIQYHTHKLLLLKCNAKYKEVKKNSQKLLQSTTNEEFKNFLTLIQRSCDSVLYWQRCKQRERLQNLHSINTIHSEVGPFSLSGGLVYSSNHESVIIQPKDGINNQPYYDLYYATKTGEDFSSGVSFSRQLNDRFHETGAKFSEDEKEVYFSRTESLPVSKNKLLKSVKNKGGWTLPEKFRFDDSSSNFNHPYISTDGSMFLFSSDMAGGYGGMDLYISFLEDSIWSDPINLGPEINSRYNEITPFLKEDRLYFSSDHILGAGGYDVYWSVLKGDTWTAPLNFRFPVNSSGDDFGFVFDKNSSSYGYVVSNRSSSVGMEDIFKVLIASKKK